ncbi:hypothetical protein TSOC_008121 [Tetrabaena socialis]|uniref:Uncharacterized protein n=1 Tax=Tetrabaena socialis TaxID=47790 RepID=A0A2J7ZZD7_9CHLO|nr:hypothetical protein TSOC_008121 [Tetrabaena socialis]|eukprot:PNH05630.1 hypothetical protein TSOC_008121 [Tetrabaena socialis]
MAATCLASLRGSSPRPLSGSGCGLAPYGSACGLAPYGSTCGMAPYGSTCGVAPYSSTCGLVPCGSARGCSCGRRSGWAARASPLGRGPASEGGTRPGPADTDAGSLVHRNPQHQAVVASSQQQRQQHPGHLVFSRQQLQCPNEADAERLLRGCLAHSLLQRLGEVPAGAPPASLQHLGIALVRTTPPAPPEFAAIAAELERQPWALEQHLGPPAPYIGYLTSSDPARQGSTRPFRPPRPPSPPPHTHAHTPTPQLARRNLLWYQDRLAVLDVSPGTAARGLLWGETRELCTVYEEDLGRPLADLTLDLPAAPERLMVTPRAMGGGAGAGAGQQLDVRCTC